MSQAESSSRDESGGASEVSNLQQLLERMRDAGDSAQEAGAAGEDGKSVCLGHIVATVGKRSFGPLLLMAGVIAASPLSGIPGMPTAMGVLILLVAGQMLFGRSHVWLPQWLLKRRFGRKRLSRAIDFLLPVARFIDRLIRPRLTAVTESGGAYVIAGICFLVAASMPPLELVPFAATAAGAVVTLFGLALIAHDGLLALLGMALAVVAIFTAYSMLGG